MSVCLSIASTRLLSPLLCLTVFLWLFNRWLRQDNFWSPLLDYLMGRPASWKWSMRNIFKDSLFLRHFLKQMYNYFWFLCNWFILIFKLFFFNILFVCWGFDGRVDELENSFGSITKNEFRKFIKIF